MTTRQQDERAEWLATRYGRSAVRPLPDGAIIAIGMIGDVEYIHLHITPEGSVSPASREQLDAAERHGRRHERRECWRCGYPTPVTRAECVRCGTVQAER